MERLLSKREPSGLATSREVAVRHKPHLSLVFQLSLSRELNLPVPSTTLGILG